MVMFAVASMVFVPDSDSNKLDCKKLQLVDLKRFLKGDAFYVISPSYVKKKLLRESWVII